MIEYLQQNDSFCMAKSNFGRRSKMGVGQLPGATPGGPPGEGGAHTGMGGARTGMGGALTGSLNLFRLFSHNHQYPSLH